MAKFTVKFEAKAARSLLSKLMDPKRWKRALKALVATVGFKDVVKHFQDQRGEDGRWPKLNPSYARWKRRQGKTKMLVLSGQLRQGFLPSNITDAGRMGVALFNPVEYSGKHDRGEGVPKRQFMWLSRSAMDLMEKGFAFAVTRVR